MTVLLARYNRTQNITKKISDTFCIYNSNDFANIPRKIARPNKSGFALVKVIGQCLPRLSDWTIEFKGEWKQSSKYGYTFFADSHSLISPSNERGIEKFLSGKSFPGVGEKTAKAIVKEFGTQTLEIIENSPNLLLRVDGINPDKIGTIVECYRRDISFSRLCSYLSTFGISQTISSKIKEKYGDAAIDIIKENPYTIQEIRGIGFLTCEKIARKENVGLDSYIRIQGAMIETIRSCCESSGNMFMTYEDFRDRSLSMLNSEFRKDVVSEEIFKAAVKRAHDSKILVFVEGKYVYLKEFFDAEDLSARRLAYLIKGFTPLSQQELDNGIMSYLSSSSVRLSEAQKTAVRNSLNAPVSIITGGPGTGKTTILKAIIEVYRKLFPDKEITLLAPTGKAATRMRLTSGYEASTIHSKLCIFEDYEVSDIMLGNGLVVVDETSMVDNLLLAKLLKAIEKGSQLVFVGDTDQLPSVGPGAVLQEMIASESIPVSRLTEVFRQKEGGTIIENASIINNGNSSIQCDDSFELVEVENEEEAVRKIKEIYLKECRNYGEDNVALLTPLRRSQSGRFTCVSDCLNEEIQDTVNPANGTSVVCGGTEFRLNDRVLEWKNTKEVTNGDVGIITELGQNDSGIYAEISWDNGVKTIENRESLNDVTLGYAMSVHKSQGSEYDSVIIPMLSGQICRLFRRNLLYTAITRAKKHVTLIVDEENKAIPWCVQNTDSNRRNTLLSLRIRKYCG